MTVKGKHAIDFAIFCTSWHYYYNEKHDDYLFHNAEKGWVPKSGNFEALTPEELYKRFIKQTR